LNALGRLYPTTDINRIRTHLTDRIGHVGRVQAARQNQRCLQPLGNQAPVKCLTGTAWRATDIGIQQKTARIWIGGLDRRQGNARLDPDGLDETAPEGRTKSVVLITMKLKQFEGNFLADPSHELGGRIDEKSNHSHKSRNTAGD